jgi:hypothetical protein
MGIKKETLQFVEDAKKYFETKEGRIVGSTYEDTKLGYIALRWGMLDDCMKVFELGDEIGFFENWIDRVPYEDQIDYYIERISNNDLHMTKNHINNLQRIIDKKAAKLGMERY